MIRIDGPVASSQAYHSAGAGFENGEGGDRSNFSDLLNASLTLLLQPCRSRTRSGKASLTVHVAS
jgi:hypothetical protein